MLKQLWILFSGFVNINTVAQLNSTQILWGEPEVGVYYISILKNNLKTSSQKLTVQLLNMHFQLVAFKGILTSDAVFAELGMNSSFMLLYHTIYLHSVSKSLPPDSFLKRQWNKHD